MTSKSPRGAHLERRALLAVLCVAALRLAPGRCELPEQQFPGVARELASFCAARPSLPVDVAAMVVHVKRNTSFNYKLYLFSADHTFQTGQVVPRADFRLHSFPVKLRPLAEFWPRQTPTFRFASSAADSQVPAPASSFSLREFLRRVPLQPSAARPPRPKSRARPPSEDQWDALPGDEVKSEASGPISELNRHIHFDRDDQVSAAHRRAPSARHSAADLESGADSEFAGASIVPVGAFSSFHANLSYLVRKDFDQREPQIVQVTLDAHRFAVSRLLLVSDGAQNSSSYPRNEDYDFLSHGILRDADTRITAVSQIYEDWITRNFYTLVYVQRRLAAGEPAASERLVFRGSSAALLGAEPLDYGVRAAAFVTERNGLHYYLEFLAAANRFRLCAIDWSRRPFKVVDSRQFPIKATRAQLDNEELLLCPPAVCHSDQPVDEVISYGRLPLSEQHQRLAGQLASASARPPTSASALARLELGDLQAGGSGGRSPSPNLIAPATSGGGGDANYLDSSLESGATQLETKLHLRDWTWTLTPSAGGELAHNGSRAEPTAFQWRYELARRNDIKVRPDTYGYVLFGHEIDASYRVYNELYLVSANHLITINYTLASETVTSSQPIGDEFPGLSSSLVDPITGAFYERRANQVYFFKGDRYVGYDYATKRPLEDFQLQAPASLSSPSGAESRASVEPALVTSLPVIGILGRQHYVDGIHHDLAHDLVFVFAGMRFYTLEGRSFKDGTFRSSEAEPAPRMRCVNSHLLAGCRFDSAYPNPCRDEDAPADTSNSVETDDVELIGAPRLAKRRNLTEILSPSARKDSAFSEEQQSKLRTIASRGSLLDSLLEPTLLQKSVAKVVDSAPDAHSRSQEAVVIYLLVAMVGLTILLTVAMIVVLVNWTRVSGKPAHQQQVGLYAPSDVAAQPPLAFPSRQYMANQRQWYGRRLLPPPRVSPPKPPAPSPVRAQRQSYRNESYYVAPQSVRVPSKHPSRAARRLAGDDIDSSAL